MDEIGLTSNAEFIQMHVGEDCRAEGRYALTAITVSYQVHQEYPFWILGDFIRPTRFDGIVAGPQAV